MSYAHHWQTRFTVRAKRIVLVLLFLAIGVVLFASTGGYGARERFIPPLAKPESESLSGGSLAPDTQPLSAQRLSGLYPAVPLRIIDGDTVEMRVAIWLGQDVTTRVRLRGIDAPELRARCEAERIGAETARRRLEALLKVAPVFLTDIGYDKYGTRVVARILDGARADLGQRLVDEKLARPYSGGKRQGWCDGAAVAASN